MRVDVDRWAAASLVVGFARQVRKRCLHELAASPEYWAGRFAVQGFESGGQDSNLDCAGFEAAASTVGLTPVNARTVACSVPGAGVLAECASMRA